MKVFFIFISLCFIVSAKKHKKSKITDRYGDLSSDSSSSDSDEMEDLPFSDGFFDTRGAVRKYFALEAALLDHGRNMICSPVAAAIPLSKLLIGATGKAETELIDAIGLKKRAQLPSALAIIITNLMFLEGVTLDLASRIYVSSEKSINKTFNRFSKIIFRSSVHKIDVFNPKETANKINDWVAENTRDKIKRLLSSSDITKDTSMIMVSAIYFAGKWKHQFEQSFTDDFHSPSGVRRLPMMSRKGRYKYWKCDKINAEVIEIPYEGSQSSMIIVLPFSNTGLTVLLRALKLSIKLLNDALDKMKYTELILTMPKFKIESEIDLTYLFQKIGVNSIFDSRKSGLTGIMKDEEVYVSKAIHKAIIEVNEKGTTASVVTGMVLEPLSSILGYDVRVNRPFLFYINVYEEQLFSGTYNGNN